MYLSKYIHTSIGTLGMYIYMYIILGRYVCN